MKAGMLSARRVPLLLGPAVLLLVAGCYAGAKESAQPTEPSDPKASSMAEATAPPETGSFGLCGSTDVWIDYAPHTTATLAGYGWDFLVAEVVSFEPAIFNTPDGEAPPEFPNQTARPDANPNAETMIYTPVNVVINEVISGPWSAGENQFLIEGGTVPIEGGIVDCYTVRVDAAPHVEVGSRYVLIVSDALRSDGRTPLSSSKARFAWTIDSNQIVTTVDGPMSIEDLSRLVLDAAPSSVPGGTGLPLPMQTGAST